MGRRDHSAWWEPPVARTSNRGRAFGIRHTVCLTQLRLIIHGAKTPARATRPYNSPNQPDKGFFKGLQGIIAHAGACYIVCTLPLQADRVAKSPTVPRQPATRG